MSSCNTNKFLGLNSIDVLLEAFDKRIEEQYIDSRVCTLQLYNYFPAGETITLPSPNIFYDFDSNVIRFPNNYNGGWNTLAEIVKDLSEDALSKGSVYTSVRVQTGIDAADDNTITEWSKPVKISGVNGRSGAEFRFSNTEICAHADRSKVFTAPTAENPIVYFWTTDENGIWAADDVPGNVWMKYTADGKDGKDGVDGCGLRYQYCITKENKLEQVGNWQEYIPELTDATPYLWVRTQLVQGDNQPIGTWSTAKLFSTIGRDGNVPDYTVTLYCKGTNTEEITTPIGVIAPAKPELIENSVIDDYKNENWLELPGDDEGIWWQCTFNITGIDDKVVSISNPKRYNGVDGNALPGECTKMLFKWSENQLAPTIDKSEDKLVDGWKPAGWNEDPNTEIIEGPEISLWMIVCNINGVTDAGVLNVVSISDPVKISGPRGSLSYDYRVEMRYYNGDATNPKRTPQSVQWYDSMQTAEQQAAKDPANPYIWTYPVLVYYTMRYGELKEDGTYSVETYGNPQVAGNQTIKPYRLSGLNGEDGNTKNNILVSNEGNATSITSFSTNNYYVYTGGDTMNYNLNFSEVDFISGYTGKFINAGLGTVNINVSGKYALIGYGKTYDDKIKTVSLNSGESVELVTYNNTPELSFIVVGKAL